jgi:hypothetical protein
MAGQNDQMAESAKLSSVRAREARLGVLPAPLSYCYVRYAM